MKKVLCLIVGLAFLVGSAATTMAGELDIYGQYWAAVSAVNNAGYFEANPFNNDEDGDDWHAYQRIRQYFEYIASDRLKAVVAYEVDTRWGNQNQAGGFEADETGLIEVKRAMLKYTAATDTTLNIGIQGFALPSGATGNPVLGGDMSGITLNQPVNENMSLTLGWIRVNEDSPPGRTPAGDGDSDAFAAVLPISMEGMSFTPYVLYSYLGKDFLSGQDYAGDASAPFDGDQWGSFLGTLAGEYQGVRPDDNGNAFWIGVPVSFTRMDPLVFDGQFIYGSITGMDTVNPATDDDALERRGFFADLSAKMNLGWGTPTIFGLYSSGDDDDFDDGSETFPTLFSDGFVAPPFASAFGFNGCCSNLSLGKDYSFAQYIPNGVWEIGAGVQNLSFMDKLSNDIGITYTRGTNDEDVGKFLAGNNNYTPVSGVNIVLTDEDSAWQFRLYNQYDINENLYVALDIGAAIMDMDDDVWKARGGDDYLDDPVTYSTAAISYSF